jgi:hypothetical protein
MRRFVARLEKWRSRSKSGYMSDIQVRSLLPCVICRAVLSRPCLEVIAALGDDVIGARAHHLHFDCLQDLY